jgi:AraC-like DNA-binding protein
MNIVRHRFADAAAKGAPYFVVAGMRYTPETDSGGRPVPLVERDYADVEICLRGICTNVVRDRNGVERIIEMRPGRVHLWRPQDLRGQRVTVKSREPVDLMFVGFRPQDWQTFAALAGADPALLSRPEPFYSDVPDTAVLSAFDEMLRRVESRPTMLDLIRFWTAVIGQVLPISDEFNLRAPEWLTNAVGSLRTNEADLRGGARRLRELAHVSDRHLARLSHRWFGRSPSQLVEDLRIQHARRLLLETDESVTRIAERCGFASPAYFSGRFRHAVGVSPRGLRESALGSR